MMNILNGLFIVIAILALVLIAVIIIMLIVLVAKGTKEGLDAYEYAKTALDAEDEIRDKNKKEIDSRAKLASFGSHSIVQ